MPNDTQTLPGQPASVPPVLIGLPVLLCPPAATDTSDATGCGVAQSADANGVGGLGCAGAQRSADTRPGGAQSDGGTIIGVDPGQKTGVAIYSGRKLIELKTIAPVEYAQFFAQMKIAGPISVVMEDSRLQSHVWTMEKGAAAKKVARNIGRVDAYCALIDALGELLGFPVRGLSPKDKGSKIDKKRLSAVTGWAGASNQHERDAAMVALRAVGK